MRKINWTAVLSAAVTVTGVLGEHTDKLTPNVAHGVIAAGVLLQMVTRAVQHTEPAK